MASNRAPGFVLRLPPKLKRALAKVARVNHRHLYQEAVLAVEQHVAREQAPAQKAEQA